LETFDRKLRPNGYR